MKRKAEHQAPTRASKRSSRCSWRLLGKTSGSRRPRRPQARRRRRESRWGSRRWRRSSTATSPLNRELQTAYDALKLAPVSASSCPGGKVRRDRSAFELGRPRDQQSRDDGHFPFTRCRRARAPRVCARSSSSVDVAQVVSAAMESRLGRHRRVLEDAREGISAHQPGRPVSRAPSLVPTTRFRRGARPRTRGLVRISTRIATPGFARIKAKLLCELGDVPRGARQARLLGQVVANLLVNAAQALRGSASRSDAT